VSPNARKRRAAGTYPPESFLHHLFPYRHSGSSGMATTARFRFSWWTLDFATCMVASITWRRARGKIFRGSCPFPRAAAMKLARATLTLAWHTVRTDTKLRWCYWVSVLRSRTHCVVTDCRTLTGLPNDTTAACDLGGRPTCRLAPALACSRETDVNAHMNSCFTRCS